MSKKKFVKLLIAVLFVLFITISDKFSLSKKVIDEEVIVHFIDVGQGDSIFIESEDGSMLIDAGEASSSDKVIKYIKDRGYGKIDYIIGTHPHTDHIGGLKDVIETFEVGTIYMPRVVHTSKTYEDLLKSISEKGKNIKTAKSGVYIIDGENVSVQILSPTSDKYTELNNYSAVLKMVYGSVSFLFMGDAERLVEDEIINNVSADVIKVGHHGSNTSSSNEFVRRVNARYAIIQVGKSNQYGLPKSEVLRRWEKSGAIIYRNDINGDIVVTTDGENIEVSTEK